MQKLLSSWEVDVCTQSHSHRLVYNCFLSVSLFTKLNVHLNYYEKEFDRFYLQCIGLLPSAVDSGGFVRNEDGTLKPVMSTKEPITDEMIGGVTCNCKTECLSRKCKCFDSGNRCSILCHKGLKYRSENCRNCI